MTNKTDLVEKAEVVDKAPIGGSPRVVELDLVATTTFDPEDEYRPEPVPEPLPPAWLEGGIRIGIHTSIAGSHMNALESAAKLGCTALQIFSVNPRMWAGGAVAARITEAEAKAFRDRRAVLGLGPLVIHANYLINLAAPAPMLRTRSIQSFHEELVRGIALGADFIVVHPGSYTDSRPEQAVGTVIESVKQAVKRLPANSMRILIENTAGMGNAVGSRLEEVGEIVAGLNSIGAGACLDTAHLFAAGYDIRTPGGLESTIEMIDQTIGLVNVPVIHANDSKIALGGRVDRHEHIGKGKIGADAFRRILTHPNLGATYPEGLPGRAFIAETPIEDPGDDRKNVAALWELAGLSEKAPAAEKGYSMLTAAAKKKAAELAKKAAKKKKKS
jgi:deoxyribonuclease IV